MIDPQLPNSPSLLRLIMPSFHAPPCLLPAVSVGLFRPSIFTANVSKLDQDPVDMDCSSHLALECVSGLLHNKPAKSENTSFILRFGLPSTQSQHFSKANMELFKDALQTVSLLTCWLLCTICLCTERAGRKRDLAVLNIVLAFQCEWRSLQKQHKMLVWTNVETKI